MASPSSSAEAVLLLERKRGGSAVPPTYTCITLWWPLVPWGCQGCTASSLVSKEITYNVHFCFKL